MNDPQTVWNPKTILIESHKYSARCPAFTLPATLLLFCLLLAAHCHSINSFISDVGIHIVLHNDMATHSNCRHPSYNYQIFYITLPSDVTHREREGMGALRLELCQRVELNTSSSKE